MNTHQIKQLISISKFDNPLTVVDDVVFVNLDCLTNREYQNQGINELLFLTGKYTNHNFVFLIRDGVNCKFTGLIFLIRSIVQNLNLDQDTCFVYSYDDLNIENTTFIELDVVQMWCGNIGRQLDLPLSHSRCTKKFAGLYGRHDLYRLKMFRHLHENYSHDSVLSYNANVPVWNHRFAAEFDNDQQWYEKNGPVLLDFDRPSGWVPFQHSLENISKHYTSYFLEVVSETDIYSNRFFTEKSLKNFYLGKPFLLFSGTRSLQYLRSKGFRTFDSCINEDYDTIDNPYARYCAIIKEIDRLAQFSIAELQQLLDQLAPIFEHNRQRFEQIASGKN